MNNLYNEYLSKLMDKGKANVYSLISKCYIDQFKMCLENPRVCRLRDISDYQQYFSRETVSLLHRIMVSANIKNKLNKVATHFNMLIDKARKLFDGLVLYTAILQSRLAINTSTPTLPLDINIAWDPFFDLPYIPSSALKGVVRSYFEVNSITIDGFDIDTLFGSKSSVGALIFFDSYPVSCRNSLIDPEVLTPHYIEAEYRIDEASSSPRPLVYPTIATGTTFYILIAINLKQLGEKLSINTWNSVVNRVREALETGIGAKTSLGYGYFKVQPTIKTP